MFTAVQALLKISDNKPHSVKPAQIPANQMDKPACANNPHPLPTSDLDKHIEAFCKMATDEKWTYGANTPNLPNNLALGGGIQSYNYPDGVALMISANQKFCDPKNTMSVRFDMIKLGARTPFKESTNVSCLANDLAAVEMELRS